MKVMQKVGRFETEKKRKSRLVYFIKCYRKTQDMFKPHLRTGFQFAEGNEKIVSSP